MNNVIKWIRIISGIEKVNDAAKLLGISKSYISALEGGTRNITDELLEKIIKWNL